VQTWIWSWEIITLIQQPGSKRLTILKDGKHHGMIERDKAYPQQMSSVDLRELADLMDKQKPHLSR